LPDLARMSPPREEDLAACFLAGFPDRVAQVRAVPGRRAVAGSALDRIELALCQGGGARLSAASTVRDSRFLVAVAAEDTPSRGNAATSTEVRVAVGLEPEQLLEAPPGFLQESSDLTWDEARERVVARSRLTYGSLLVEESLAEEDPDSAAAVLARELAARWPKPFADDEPLRQYAARREFLQRLGDPSDLPDLSAGGFLDFLKTICRDRRSFAEIARTPLAAHIRSVLTAGQAARLDRLAPEKITVGAGRKTAVHYEPGATPWVASRLQDLFGTDRTPAVAEGKVSLVVHLLAPNNRPLQITMDLGGFWQREYPRLRRQYMRRYPRHPWPENPLTAEPPQRHKEHRDQKK
jgi:ATP-dependent helicase HrpB